MTFEEANVAIKNMKQSGSSEEQKMSVKAFMLLTALFMRKVEINEDNVKDEIIFAWKRIAEIASQLTDKQDQWWIINACDN